MKDHTMPDIAELIDIERKIATANVASRNRNQLLADLVASGHRQSDLTRTINSVRQELGDAPVTLGSVHIAIRRAKATAT